MSATRILWGQILAVLVLTLAGVWSATQWIAAALELVGARRHDLLPIGLVAAIVLVAEGDPATVEGE